MFFGNTNNKLLAVADGMAVPLDENSDAAEFGGMNGSGYAIEPISGTMYSPVTGMIVSVSDTKQRYEIKADNGQDVLIRIGEEGINHDGKSFISLVEHGDLVQAGDVIAKVDIAKIKKEGHAVTTPVILSCADDIKECDLKLGWVRGGRSAVMRYKI